MIFYECYADESLLRYIGFNSSDLKGGHSSGRSRVSAKLKNTRGALGLIDEDPGAPKDEYLKYLFGLNPIHSDALLIAIFDPKTDNKIIVLRPNLEAWAVAMAKDKGIDLRNYGLENDWRKLHDVMRIEKNERKRKRFVEFMRDIALHPSILKLKNLVD